jgi:hypothetical protein
VFSRSGYSSFSGLFFVCRLFLFGYGLVLVAEDDKSEIKHSRNSQKRKKAQYRRSSRQFITTETTMGEIIRDPIDQAKT